MYYSARNENSKYRLLATETNNEATLLEKKRKAIAKIRAMADKALQSSDDPKKPVEMALQEWRVNIKTAANMATHEVIYAKNIKELELVDI